MGLLRLFLPSFNNRDKFDLDHHNWAGSSQLSHTHQQNILYQKNTSPAARLKMKLKKSILHYLKKMIRPREFFAEFLGEDNELFLID